MSDGDGPAERGQAPADASADVWVRPPAKDPMKSFRGVMAGALILEAITVGLALPVVARLGGGVGTGKGWAVVGIAVAFLLCCAVLKRPWIVPVILALQVGLIAFFFLSITAIGVIGLLFLAFWLWALWLRRDVARRMAAGTLPSQQPGAQQ